MSLFDQLVNEALKSRADLTTLRPVVEKELLHHDILRELSEAGLLVGLTFIGGTCLRACYGSARLSEDLDFTGGNDFNRRDLAELATVLTTRLLTRYGLPVSVSEPLKTGGKVSTWKLTVETRPGVLEALLQPRRMEALLHVARSSSSPHPREEAPLRIRQSRSYHGCEQRIAHSAYPMIARTALAGSTPVSL